MSLHLRTRQSTGTTGSRRDPAPPPSSGRTPGAPRAAAGCREPNGGASSAVYAVFLVIVLLGPFPVAGVAQQMLLNDTGLTRCHDGSNLVACSEANTGDAATLPRQDGRFGRDAQALAGLLAKTGAGPAGFDLTRICNSGQAAGEGDCPASPSLGSGMNDWACVRDNVTGRTWEVKTLANRSDQYTWADATAVYAAAVNGAALCGFDDWRLPSRRELLSIVDGDDASAPVTIGGSFPNTRNSAYWSGDTYALTGGGGAWVVNTNGTTTPLSKGFSLFVRLVRGGEAAAQSCPGQTAYTVHGDGTVSDNVSGLIWDRCSWGQTPDGDACTGVAANSTGWQGALNLALTANANAHRGHTDWRLPSLIELESLVDVGCDEPTINRGIFPGTALNYYWTSTNSAIDPDRAFGVSFGNSQVVAFTKGFILHVRLVRGGSSFDTLTFVNGACGAADGGLFTAPPGEELCAAGVASPVTSAAGEFTWSCAGEGGGAIAQCSAAQGYMVTSTAGAGGSIDPAAAQTIAHGQTAQFVVTPDEDHIIDSVAGSCGGTLAGTLHETDPVTADCTVEASFLPVVDGVCGASAGVPSLTAPTVLCEAGSAGAVASAEGFHAWSCAGENGGGDAQCDAPGADAAAVGGQGHVTVALAPQADCTLAQVQLVAAPQPLPPGVVLPHGALDVTLAPCSAEEATLLLSYSEPVDHLLYWKHRDGGWLQWPEAQLAGHDIALTLINNGPYDVDPDPNVIRDPSGPGTRPLAIPSLGPWGLLVLLGLLGAIGLFGARLRARR